MSGCVPQIASVAITCQDCRFPARRRPIGHNEFAKLDLVYLDKRQISSYYADMRRKPGALLPIELSILEAGIELRLRAMPYFHGFLIAKEVKEREDARLLTAHGTLYKALERMQKAGLLESEWEDPLLAAAEGRPRRRLYRVTAAGEAARVQARVPLRRDATRRRPETGPVTP